MDIKSVFITLSFYWLSIGLSFGQCDAFPGIPPENPVNICGTEAFCLFDYLGTDDTIIQTDGVWTGPSGWTWDGELCASFDPSAHPPGDYTYTVIGTDGCTDSATITMAYADDGIVSIIAYCDGGFYDLFSEVCIPEDLPLSGTWYYPGQEGYPSAGSEVSEGIIDTEVDPSGEYVYYYFDESDCISTIGVNLILPTGGAAGCENSIEYSFGQGGFCPFEHLGCDPEPGGQWIVWGENSSFLDFFPITNECISDYDIAVYGEYIRFQYILGAFPCDPAFTDVHVNVQGLDSNGLITNLDLCLGESLYDPIDSIVDPRITDPSSLEWTFSSTGESVPLFPFDSIPSGAYPQIILQYTIPSELETPQLGFVRYSFDGQHAGDDVLLEFCESPGTTVDLFEFITGDLEGEFSGNLFEMIPENSGVYTYEVINEICPTDYAEITVLIVPYTDTDGDGICDSDEIVGCQNPSAANYNPLATDPGPCELGGGFENDLTELIQQPGEFNDGISGISLGANNAESSTFKIYPNPAREYFLLESTSVSITEVIIMSPDGKVVGIVSPETAGAVKIDTSELAAGLYLVKTRLEDGNLVSRKVLIEK